MPEVELKLGHDAVERLRGSKEKAEEATRDEGRVWAETRAEWRQLEQLHAVLGLLHSAHEPADESEEPGASLLEHGRRVDAALTGKSFDHVLVFLGGALEVYEAACKALGE